MRKKSYFSKFFVGAVALTFVLAPLMPAKAFFLVYDGQTCNINGVEMPGPCPASQMDPQQGGNYNSGQQQMGPSSGGQFGSNQTGQSPNNFGSGSQQGGNFGPGQQQMGPGDQGGQNFGPDNQGGMMGPGGNYGPGPGDQGGMMGPGGQEGQQGPSDEQQQQRQKQQEARQLKDMKRNVRQMESGIKQFEKMVQKAEKSGTAVPAEIKEKLEKAKNIIAAIKSATTMEEIQAAGMEDFGNLMQELDQARQDLFEKAQRLQDVKRGVKGMEQGMRMFEKQLAMFAKQKVAVPQEVTDTLAKIKEMIGKIKNAQTWDEVEAAGLEDMQDMFQKLDESRQQLEVLARWPQTLKQVDRELKRLTTELKKTKTLAVRLVKKGVDVSGLAAEFEAAVGKLKSVRDDAVAKIGAGQSEEAFDLLENEFFGQMEDVWEFQQVIMMMSNLGRFASDFKRGINDAQNQIKRLQRQKLDVTELQDLLNQGKAKGNEVLALMKVKPIDQDAVMAGIQELENLMQEFEGKMEELTGEERGGPMPWEQGKDQFQRMEMPSGVQKFIPQRESGNQGGGPGGMGSGPQMSPEDFGPQTGPGTAGGGPSF